MIKAKLLNYREILDVHGDEENPWHPPIDLHTSSLFPTHRARHTESIKYHLITKITVLQITLLLNVNYFSFKAKYNIEPNNYIFYPGSLTTHFFSS